MNMNPKNSKQKTTRKKERFCLFLFKKRNTNLRSKPKLIQIQNHTSEIAREMELQSHQEVKKKISSESKECKEEETTDRFRRFK